MGLSRDLDKEGRCRGGNGRGGDLDERTEPSLKVRGCGD